MTGEKTPLELTMQLHNDNLAQFDRIRWWLIALTLVVGASSPYAAKGAGLLVGTAFGHP